MMQEHHLMTDNSNKNNDNYLSLEEAYEDIRIKALP